MIAINVKKLMHFYVIALFIVPERRIHVFSQSGVTSKDLGQLYDGLVKNLAYFDSHYQYLDADALLGLRIAEGYISKLVEDCEHERIKTNLKVYNNLKDLQNRVAVAIKKVLPAVKENDPAFYPLLDSKWHYYKPYNFLLMGDDEGLLGQGNEPGNLEQYSHCVGEIVGRKDSGREFCTISEDCWNLMTSKIFSRKTLHLQALYFILGEAAGCLDRIISHMGPSRQKLERLTNNICAASYLSVSWSSFHGGGDPEDLILILKQSFTCGLLGYHQLLLDQGLGNAVGWQLKSGCYGDYTKSSEPKKSADEIKQARRELKSTYLGEGCYGDVTGVGLGLLAVYLRWVLDPPPQVEPVNILQSAEKEAKTVSMYMMGLLVLTAVFLIVFRHALLSMLFYFWGFCCKKIARK